MWRKANHPCRSGTRTALPLMLLLAVGGTAHPLHAQGTTEAADVTGIVADATTGLPVSAAMVEVRDTDRRAVTDGDGRFVLLDVPSGPHEWRISALGYAAWEQTMAVANLDVLRIGLMPRPVALENITVTVDRLETRRRVAAVSVTVVERAELIRSTSGDVVAEARARSPFPTGKCPRQLTKTGLYEPDVPWRFCMRYRGGAVKPVVWLDERRVPMEVLMGYHPSELYAIEFYGAGLSPKRDSIVPQIRVYTVDFMERGHPLRPLFY